MLKKLKFNPVIRSGLQPGDDTVIGGGTGQSGFDEFPCDYDYWIILFENDFDGDGETNWSDYKLWMESHDWGDWLDPIEDPGY